MNLSYVLGSRICNYIPFISSYLHGTKWCELDLVSYWKHRLMWNGLISRGKLQTHVKPYNYRTRFALKTPADMSWTSLCVKSRKSLWSRFPVHIFTFQFLTFLNILYKDLCKCLLNMRNNIKLSNTEFFFIVSLCSNFDLHEPLFNNLFNNLII